MSNVIDALNIDGIDAQITLPYGTCETAANVQQKEVTIPNFKALIEGAKISIKFFNNNSVAEPTLKVNNFDALYIKSDHLLTPMSAPPITWTDGAILTFTYDGHSWIQDSSIKASYDANGNNIVSTYATKIELSDILPEVTTADNGKFLRVVNGTWASDTVPNAEEASF